MRRSYSYVFLFLANMQPSLYNSPSSHTRLSLDDDQARGKTTRLISMIEMSYEKASRINHMSLVFIGATLILASRALKKDAKTEVFIVGEVYGIALPCLQYTGHLFSLY